ncbi:MAG TPA: aconitase X catalytic domain-containing protein [Nocardioidaceae bacterium]|nr:aconitase X catalytic domain-containing protein [Nocardioidaceae bacterium]
MTGTPHLTLTPDQQSSLDGRRGPATAMAMRLVCGVAEAAGAQRLRPIDSAHVDGCLYHGQAGLDLVEKFAELGGRVAVRTTLNVGSLDLLHPGMVRTGHETSAAAALMDAHVRLGCEPTWSCAPYQITHRPAFGTHVAWGESNAIAFVNSVLGARTGRYGDFMDIAAALTGLVPDTGLHRDHGRRADVVLDCGDLPGALLETDSAWAALGVVVGELAGTRVPALVGLPGNLEDGVTEDRLKALGAAAASAGGVALFHVVGVTPEAPTLTAVADALTPVVEVDLAHLRAARTQLTTAIGDTVDAVSLGTPHFSVREFAALATAIGAGPRFSPDVTVLVATSRAVLQEATRLGYVDIVEQAGARILTDTCTYVAPVLSENITTVMTNSGKWAWYAPGNLGVDVVLGDLHECVASARVGRVVRDDRLWT